MTPSLHLRSSVQSFRRLLFVLVIVPLSIFLFSPVRHVQPSSSPFIQFLGAAQMVGGSSYLIDTGKTRFLVDSGFFYGSEYQEKNEKLDFDPSTIDFILLTHAHIDHSGRIPFLYQKGFKGKTVGTDATKSILGVMLKMSMNIAQGQGKAIFGLEDLTKCMNGFMTIPYDQKIHLAPDVAVRFKDAGHILGSSIIEIWIKDGEKPIKMVVAADLGSKETPLLRDPAIITEADYVLVESTYGTDQRGQPNYREFGKAIQETLNKGGSVLIPVFVLEKTQKVLYVIGQMKREGIIPPSTLVYADSSTAQEITRIYRQYSQYYDAEALKLLSSSGDPLSFPGLQEISGQRAMETHNGNQPAIYLSSSGMLDHGYAPKHLEKMIEDPKNLLLIVGWQAPDSLGRRLQEGVKKVRIPIKNFGNRKIETTHVEKTVKMKVMKFGGFSSHADGCETLEWLSHFPKLKEVFVVHGDKENAIGLAKAVESKLGFKASAPSLNETRRISSTVKDHPIKRTSKLCEEGAGAPSGSSAVGGISDH